MISLFNEEEISMPAGETDEQHLPRQNQLVPFSMDQDQVVYYHRVHTTLIPNVTDVVLMK